MSVGATQAAGLTSGINRTGSPATKSSAAQRRPHNDTKSSSSSHVTPRQLTTPHASSTAVCNMLHSNRRRGRGASAHNSSSIFTISASSSAPIRSRDRFCARPSSARSVAPKRGSSPADSFLSSSVHAGGSNLPERATSILLRQRPSPSTSSLASSCAIWILLRAPRARNRARTRAHMSTAFTSRQDSTSKQAHPLARRDGRTPPPRAAVADFSANGPASSSPTSLSGPSEAPSQSEAER